MGISIAASAQKSGSLVYWSSEGRSEQTLARAKEHHLEDAKTIENLCTTCDLIISICPPHAAEDVANQVRLSGFKGQYIDANAISPQRSIKIGKTMVRAGIDFIDGSIIGGPAWQPDCTWLYLSGKNSLGIEEFFSAGPLEVSVIGEEIGKASALKMCFAAYTKGTTALLSAILAAAEGLGVQNELETQWSRGGSEFATHTKERVQKVTTKAWRFEGEMKEIASTFEALSIPGGFHNAAAEIYHRMGKFKNEDNLPTLTELLDTILLRTAHH
jgi:3-hydroxyisobutyrate dehydrogenase-like beta-hydroxyacid dehydrogenase